VLRSIHGLVLVAALALALRGGVAKAQDFDALVEEALKRQQAVEGGEQPLPTAPATGQLAPAPSAPAPVIPGVTPVEPGPRPYTPPAGSTPPPEDATDTAAAPAATDSSTGIAAPTDGAGTLAPAPGEASQAASGAERTRESLQPAEVNAATFSEEALAVGGANPVVLKAQILLDRAGASPGAIDGYAGGNLAKAVAAVETVLKRSVDGALDRQVWEALRGDSTQDVLVQYTITDQDLAYPFAAGIPQDYSEQAKMPSLAFTSVEEMLGERFHMDVKLLRALNPQADFASAGTTIWVASVEAEPVTGHVATIMADKGRQQVRGYDERNRLIVAYPATIGSAENPSPSGEQRIEAVAPNPVYTYNPGPLASAGSIGTLTLPPGPNSPIGTTWISLSASRCGIHGTADPTTVGKEASLGCVRLTNWDAEELADMVEPGVVVQFVE
jgi:lipoprotein-anchoring transpeptidase ErfK/SrfK